LVIKTKNDLTLKKVSLTGIARLTFFDEMEDFGYSLISNYIAHSSAQVLLN
jgi:hypothetical protein